MRHLLLAPRRLRAALARLATFHDLEVVVYRHTREVALDTSARISRVDESTVTDAAAMEPPARIEEFRRFLARGDTGYYAYVEDRVVHRTWVRRGPVVEPLWLAWGALSVGPGTAYIHYCETAPGARGLGIYPAVIARAAIDARRAGAGSVLISTDLGNVASRRGIEKAGFVEDRRFGIRVRFGVGSQRELPAATPASLA